MRLITLVTNTDRSDFARSHPLDDAKFAAMIRGVRPDWTVDAAWVCDGQFPEGIAGCDGIMITGSPASVNSGEDWVTRLEALIRDRVAARQPIFGACFGHQVIATALGGQVGPNPGGWVHGVSTCRPLACTDWFDPDGAFDLYASHKEQVLQAPDGVEVLIASEDCPVGGYRIGDHVFTVQHHSEMTADFIAALVEELAQDLPNEVTAKARDRLAEAKVDGPQFAEWVARFFEAAQEVPPQQR